MQEHIRITSYESYKNARTQDLAILVARDTFKLTFNSGQPLKRMNLVVTPQKFRESKPSFKPNPRT
jgi:hypothetical protein